MQIQSSYMMYLSILNQDSSLLSQRNALFMMKRMKFLKCTLFKKEQWVQVFTYSLRIPQLNHTVLVLHFKKVLIFAITMFVITRNLSLFTQLRKRSTLFRYQRNTCKTISSTNTLKSLLKLRMIVTILTRRTSCQRCLKLEMTTQRKSTKLQLTRLFKSSKEMIIMLKEIWNLKFLIRSLLLMT